MSTIDPRGAAEHLEGRLAFETLISELSSKFINLPPDAVDREIEDALRRFCERLDIDSAVLWQWSPDEAKDILPTHSYPPVREQPPSHAGTQERYPWVVQQMRLGRTVALGSLAEVPPEGAVDRESAREAGIKSNLTLPLVVGGEPPIGALAFNTVRVERDWPDALVARLHLVAQVFSNALARRRYDVQLRAHETRLAAGAELAGLAFYEVDFGRGRVWVDDGFRQLCGLPPDREGGLKPLEFWMERLHPDDRARIIEQRNRLHHGRVSRIAVEYRFLHPARGETWIRHLAGVARRDADGRSAATFGVLRDVTLRKRDEDQLRELSQRLIRAHEDERALIARELHDDVTQRLAVLAIDVGLAEAATPDRAQADTLRVVREELVRLSEDIHVLAYQLHPAVLEELGLVEALRTECERQGRRGRLELSADLDPVPDIGKDAALCLFRVAQEALNNVIRHANARAAGVTLRRMDGGVLVAVRDDGAGFDPAQPKAGMHLGLASMRERMRLVNGTLDIESAPGRGTTIVAWAPADAQAS